MKFIQSNKRSIVLFFLVFLSFLSFATDYHGCEVLEKTIIFKVKSATSLKFGYASPFSGQTLELLYAIKSSKATKVFPHSEYSACTNCVDITGIYRITYTEDYRLEKVVHWFMQLPDIEYAQPEFCHELFYVPNDTKLDQQYHHEIIQSFQAWDSIRSDSSIVIGITDTGVDIDHEDLIDQIAYNVNDPINGIDDDNDGYVDNFRGWDFGSNDNNPNIDRVDHGTWVAGLAAAEVDNGVGIAGSSFGARFLPIKTATEGGSLVKTWESIVYAADHGCQIINCSWGGRYKEPLGQDIVNYATFNRGSLVIASAGNNSTQEEFYPASLENVLSVGGTVASDQKWSVDNSQSSKGSSWGYYVDITAPAASYYSTGNDGAYVFMYGGTSFAAPIVSGVAALVKTAFPSLGPIALAEQLKSQSDKIDTIPYNIAYKDMLGSGRVNSYNAVTKIDKPGIRFTKQYIDRKPPYLPGDTLTLYIELANYLADVSDLMVSLEFNTKFIIPISNSFTIPIFKGNDTLVDKTQQFSFVFSKELPLDFEAVGRFVYVAKDYRNYEYTFIKTNPSSLDHITDRLATTLPANGRIGYTKNDQQNGFGLNYKAHDNLLFDGGIILSEASNKMASSFLNKQEFAVKKQTRIDEADSADYLYVSEYRSEYLDIDVTQKVYAWDNIDLLLFDYTINNRSAIDKPNVIVGNYYDWEIGNPWNNIVLYDSVLDLSISKSTEPKSICIGTMYIDQDSSTIYAVKNSPGGDGVVNLDIDDSDLVRYYCLTNSQNECNSDFLGTDIALFHSSIPQYVYAHDSSNLRMAIIFGEDVESVKTNARNLKKTMVPNITIPNGTGAHDHGSIQVFPTVVKSNVFVKLIHFNEKARGTIVDNVGNVNFRFSLSDDETSVDLHALPAGVYHVRIETETRIFNKTIIKQ